MKTGKRICTNYKPNKNNSICAKVIITLIEENQQSKTNILWLKQIDSLNISHHLKRNETTKLITLIQDTQLTNMLRHSGITHYSDIFTNNMLLSLQ